MRFSYQTEQMLPYPIERVIGFFPNPNHLPLLMPEWQRARIDIFNLARILASTTLQSHRQYESQADCGPPVPR
jgi:hypothetical protein